MPNHLALLKRIYTHNRGPAPGPSFTRRAWASLALRPAARRLAYISATTTPPASSPIDLEPPSTRWRPACLAIEQRLHASAQDPPTVSANEEEPPPLRERARENACSRPPSYRFKTKLSCSQYSTARKLAPEIWDADPSGLSASSQHRSVTSFGRRNECRSAPTRVPLFVRIDRIPHPPYLHQILLPSAAPSLTWPLDPARAQPAHP